MILPAVQNMYILHFGVNFNLMNLANLEKIEMHEKVLLSRQSEFKMVSELVILVFTKFILIFKILKKMSAAKVSYLTLCI